VTVSASISDWLISPLRVIHAAETAA